MSKIKVRPVDIMRGMETTAVESTDDPWACPLVQNVRLQRGCWQTRGGKVRLTYQTTPAVCITFDGVNDAVGLAHHSEITAFSSIPEWTIEGLCTPTSYAATRGIFCRNTATAANVDVNIYMDSTSSGRIVADLQDDAAAVTTLQITGIAAGTKVAWRVTKAATGTYTLTANGSSTTGTLGSGTMKVNTSDALAIGRKPGAGTFFLGPIDFVRVFRGVKTTYMDSYARLLNPRTPSVLADWICDIDANNYAWDRGPFGNHGAVTGSPGTTASIAVNHNPVLGLQQVGDDIAARKFYARIGAKVYPAKY